VDTVRNLAKVYIAIGATEKVGEIKRRLKNDL